MSSAIASRSLVSPRRSATMPSSARCATPTGSASLAPGTRRRRRARIAPSRASGSCTAATPRSLQAIPHVPIAVSKSARPVVAVVIVEPRRLLVRALPPLADLRRVLAIVRRAGAFERLTGGAARGEVRLRQRRGRVDERAVGSAEIREDVCGLDAGLPLDEPRVPRIEVVVRAGCVGRLALGDAGEARGQLVVPAGDVDQDLANSPRAEPDPTHLLLAQPLDGVVQLRERVIGFSQQRGLVAHRVLPRSDGVLLRAETPMQGRCEIRMPDCLPGRNDVNASRSQAFGYETVAGEGPAG